jgi:hypothetical protein
MFPDCSLAELAATSSPSSLNWTGSGLLEDGQLLTLSSLALHSADVAYSVCSLAEILEPHVLFARRDIGAARCAEILSLAARLPWNLTPGRKARANVAATIRAGSSGDGVNRPGRRGDDDVNIFAIQQNQRGEVRALANNVAGALSAQPGMTQQNYITAAPAIALSNRGRDTGDTFETLRAGSHGALPMVSMALNAHPGKRYDAESETLVCGAQSAAHGGADDNDAQAGHIFAFAERGRAGGVNVETQADLAYALRDQNAGGASKSQIAGGFGVRRLTPRECERLQGFPDDYTAWGIDEQGERVEMSDSTRYRMLGNAICRKVSAWIDSQIERYV